MQRYTPPDLNDCDKEPIQIIGKIQSYGYLLVVQPGDLIIEQVSQNIHELLNSSAGEVTGLSIDNFFPYSFLEYFNQIVSSEENNPQHSLSFELNNKHYILSVHISDGQWVLEIEPEEAGSDRSYHHHTDLVENLLYDIDKHSSLKELCQFVIGKMKPILGFDHMMVYRFDEVDDGEVIAELAEEGRQKYLGLKFPAADIPAQARKLYVENTVRGIWDVEDEPVPVIPQIRASDNSPLNLSHSFLRSVSPVHVEYLKNMGVRASFSISLVVKDRLWGLILCHHSQQPIRLNIHQRRTCTFIGKVLSQKITGGIEEERLEGFRSRLSTVRKLMAGLQTSGNLHQALEGNQSPMLEAFGAIGYALSYGGEYSSSGNIPDPWLQHILNKLKDENARVFHTHNISESFPQLEQTTEGPAGMLALKLSSSLQEYLLLFREEHINEVHWAGKPGYKDDNPQIGPRQSFEKWTEQKRHQSAPWQTEVLMLAEELRMQLIENIISMAHLPQASVEHMEMRLMERNAELEEQNQALQLELNRLRKIEARHSLNEEFSAERNRLKPLPRIKD